MSSVVSTPMGVRTWGESRFTYHPRNSWGGSGCQWNQTEYRFLPLSSAARGELRWVCDGGEGAAQCPEKTRYVELRREASVTVMRCYE